MAVNSCVLTAVSCRYVDIKRKNPGVLLLVEVGYKYRFFGQIVIKSSHSLQRILGKDAEIAAKELNIMCFLDRIFMTASIPTLRLSIHLRRLVAAGHKVHKPTYITP